MYLTTERFKYFCDDYKITNARLIPVEDFSFDFYPNEHDDPDR